MKINFLLKNIFFTLILLSFSTPVTYASPLSSKGKWPNFWFKYRPQPPNKDKPYITVRFTNSLKEACEKFAPEYKLLNIFFEEREKIQRPFFNKMERGEKVSDDEFTAATEGIKKRLHIKYLLAQSTAVEVLRQAGYEDWKNYSRYSVSGVGDLRRNSKLEKTNNRKFFQYAIYGTSEAYDVCNKMGYFK